MPAGGYALLGYNEGSFHQRMQLMMAADIFIENLEYVKSLTNGQILIADYGSSEGYNSQMFLSETLSKFRENSSNPILIVHNDLPENDWIKTFQTVLNSEESYSKLPNVYFSVIGRTFFDQILPNNSVHLGFSSHSFNWLSQPLSAPDAIIPSASNDGRFKAIASEIAHNDLNSLLRQRHKELINSGRLILQFINESISATSFCTIINAATENLMKKGIITQKKKEI